MKIAPEKLKNHLVKELFPVYVISGDEPLLSQELDQSLICNVKYF